MEDAEVYGWDLWDVENLRACFKGVKALEWYSSVMVPNCVFSAEMMPIVISLEK